MSSMTLIEAAEFVMGSDRFYREEGPAHPRTVDAFWFDTNPVTNAEFAEFVEATGYITVAERPAVINGLRQDPGSLVFTPTTGPVDLADWHQWWSWIPGAQWRNPGGAGTDIAGKMDHPVVHVAYEDAAAYANHVGKRLPTEAEHEYASGAGAGTAFAWGDEPNVDGQLMANWWQGSFPYENAGARGWVGTSPVGSFPANRFGLYDTIGNVWEWTSDLFAHYGHTTPARSLTLHSESRPRVLKGGSFLCTPQYCLRFRPSARSSQTPDSSTSHIGFRCAKTPE